MIIYYCTVILVCMNLENSLGSTKYQSPSEERYHFFDAELLQVFNTKESGNVLISPINIKLVLGMLLEGADNQTAEEIRTALRLPDDENARRNEFNNWLSTLQVKESANSLKLANRVFVSHRYNVNPNYGKTLRKFYSGGITNVKFENGKEVTQMINNWVSNQTSQLITRIVNDGQISPDNKLMVASAVYFKGIWSRPFASERSATRCFYVKDNICKDSRMMMETGYFNYGYINKLDAKAIVLPYKGKRFSMLLLLPSKRNGIKLLGRDLIHVGLNSIISQLKEEEVFVQIPHFEISYNEDLVDSLKALEISEVFNRNANLSKMFTSKLDSNAVSHIYHSTKITVNEDGSEAAAATGVLFVPLMGGTSSSFIANHPFVFFVIDSYKNSVLFAGKVVHPKTPENQKLNTNNQLLKKPLHKELFIPLANYNDTVRLNTTMAGEKENQRVHQGGPKFRSIKPFSFPSNPPKRFESFYVHTPSQKTLPPRPDTLFEPYKKGGKTVPELTKTGKKKEPESDDWRRHVLFFT